MMDDDISKLIREAKPLYFARKRFRKRMVSAFAVVLCVFTFQFFSPSSEVSYNYFSLENEIYLTENGSVIEDMGLPTDEYGLLKVV